MGTRTAWLMFCLAAGLAVGLAGAACSSSSTAPGTAPPGVVFTSPSIDQLDVPLGTRVVVAFSDPVTASALGACTASGSGATGGLCLVGPNGVVAATADLAGSDGLAVEIVAPPLDPGTTYGVYVDPAIAPTATNLPASGPLFSFTTRSSRARAAPPAVIAIEGSDPAHIGAKRPVFESTTFHLVFSEPLDPVTVTDAVNSVQLVEQASGTALPVTVLTDGIHVAIDPVSDLTAGAVYELQLGAAIHDSGGTPLAPVSFQVTPVDSLGTLGVTKQFLRTMQPGDPGPTSSRSGATRNQISLTNALIGAQTSNLEAATLQADLGDPKALGGPLAFTIRRGQRLSASGLDLKLGGVIPAGLSTGDIQIELLTDTSGRLYRNPNLPADQTPDNDRAPLYVDLVFDLAVYATDPDGNAVLSQTVLGVEATGTATASDGVLAIETVASMQLGLLGVTTAPTNIVLALITDPSATAPVDTMAPALLSAPGMTDLEQPVAAGLDLVFDEPVDIDRLRAGGLTLQDPAGDEIPLVIESQGASVVAQPVGRLSYSTTYSLVLSDVADVAGNSLPAATLTFDTPQLAGTSAPVTAVAVHPGAPCALVGATATSPGRCSGGKDTDDLYHPFTLPTNENIDVVLSQPVTASTLTLGAACNSGSVRVEQVDDTGACTAVVPGTLLVRDRGLGFVADQPWAVGAHYKLSLISGGNKSCDGGEVCGISGNAASFDPLSGNTDSDASGGPDLVIPFDGAAASTATYLMVEAAPATDVNGSGVVDGVETARDANRAGLAITNTGGAVSSAKFNGPDCLPDLDGTQNCMYLAGSIPVEMGELAMNCALPDGTTASACIPVTMAPEAVYATSIGMSATVGISISTDTEDTIMRVREPATGPVMGYIIDDGSGMPELVTVLSIYMDAPDMDITLSSHDLHSKPISIALAGPLTFLGNGRIAISLANTAAAPVTVNISAPLGISGSVDLSLPAGEMTLQLLSPAPRGGEL